jgi:hypothetical protein
VTDPGADVEDRKTYQTVTFRIPKDLKGFVAAPQAAGEQLNFEDSSAEIHPLVSPQEDGNYELRTYYLTPAIEDISKLFWRLRITGPESTARSNINFNHPHEITETHHANQSLRVSPHRLQPIPLR